MPLVESGETFVQVGSARSEVEWNRNRYCRFYWSRAAFFRKPFKEHNATKRVSDHGKQFSFGIDQVANDEVEICCISRVVAPSQTIWLAAAAAKIHRRGLKSMALEKRGQLANVMRIMVPFQSMQDKHGFPAGRFAVEEIYEISVR